MAGFSPFAQSGLDVKQNADKHTAIIVRMYFVGPSPLDLHRRMRNYKKVGFVKPKVNHSHYRPEMSKGFQVPKLRENGPGWW